LGGTGEDFVEVGYVEGLSGLRRLVRIDARGHGQSDKPDDPAVYTPERMVGDVVAVLDDLGVDQADYFGYSMGALMGFAVAKHAPDRIRSFVFGGAGPYPPPAETARMLWSGLKVGPDGLVQFATQDGLVPPGFEARLRANDFAALRAYFTSPGHADDPIDIVPATINVPSLVIVGEDDFNCAAAQKCAQQMPAATLVVLPGLNHLTAFVRSDLMLPHIKAFLNNVDAAAG
jgi:pimeloyl-ACP methyl ester carboxylesterase